MTELPDDLRELQQKLQSVRFTPSASFGPELLGRLRRGEQPVAIASSSRRYGLIAAAAACLVLGSALAFAHLTTAGPDMVTIDRCCYDLDGGGEADDGVLVLAERDARVHRLRVYEDVDGSRSYTVKDLVRLDRGRQPAIEGVAGLSAVTIQHCCIDFDGGGPDDDGLLVVGVPPERVLMAAIYETGADARTDRWLLR